MTVYVGRLTPALPASMSLTEVCDSFSSRPICVCVIPAWRRLLMVKGMSMSITPIMGTPVKEVNRFSGSFQADNIGMSIGTRTKQARKAAKMTQAELASRSGLKQSTISDLEVGKSQGTTYLASLAAALGVSALWLETGRGSPDLKDGKPITEHAEERRSGPRQQPFIHSLVSAYDGDDVLPDDVVLVPESRIEFAGGDGRINYELVEHEEPATYRRSWFQKYGINPDRVKRFRVVGDSMEPMLYPRDTILVNLDETNVIDGRMYALRYGDQLRVKHVSRRIDGTLVLRSVNPAYKDEEISPSVVDEHITIIGRVRDRSGTGGL